MDIGVSAQLAKVVDHVIVDKPVDGVSGEQADASYGPDD
jgi:hypothetical protein